MAAMAAPANATGSFDTIQYDPLTLHIFGHDGANMTVTEAADATTVTVTDTTAAGFTVESPCQQTASDTVVCPITSGSGGPIPTVSTDIDGVGGLLTVDTPTLAVVGNLSANGITMSVPRSQNQALVQSVLSFGNGNDTFHGGTGAVRVSLNGGADIADVSNDPAQADTVTCGNATIESPSDKVTVDGADVVNNSSNCARIDGPWSGTAPAAPSQLAASVVSKSQLQVAWLDNSGDEDGFHIERCKGVGCSSFNEVGTVLNTTSFVDNGLARNTVYTYRVRAFNGAGNSAYSNTATARTAS